MKKYIGIIFLSIFIFSCSTKEPTKPNNFAPIILEVAVPSKITSPGEAVSARVVNFEGIDELERVWVKVDGPLSFLKEIDLLDNGEAHDQVASDGVYTAWIGVDFFGSLERGKFEFIFHAIDNGKNESKSVTEIVFLE